MSNLPSRLHHTAYVSKNLEATRAFYEDVLGIPLVATWCETDHLFGKDRTYCHCSSGWATAARWLSSSSPMPRINHFSGPNCRLRPSAHIALNVDKETQAELEARIAKAGPSAPQPMCSNTAIAARSMSSDPDGMIVEFTCDDPRASAGDAERKAKAHAELKRWLAATTPPTTRSATTKRPEHRERFRLHCRPRWSAPMRRPDWLIDRAKLAGRFPPRTRAKELWRVARGISRAGMGRCHDRRDPRAGARRARHHHRWRDAARKLLEPLRHRARRRRSRQSRHRARPFAASRCRCRAWSGKSAAAMRCRCAMSSSCARTPTGDQDHRAGPVHHGPAGAGRLLRRSRSAGAGLCGRGQ